MAAAHAAGSAQAAERVQKTRRGRTRTCNTCYYTTRLPTTPVAELAAGIRGH